jgi:hypothetical protein
MRLLHSIQLARMQLARGPRAQGRFKSLLDAPHAHTFHRRTVHVEIQSDLVITQTRTRHTFVGFQQNASVGERPSRCLALRQQLVQLRPLLGRQLYPVDLHRTWTLPEMTP